MNLIVTCPGCGSVFRVLDDSAQDVSRLVGDRSEYWPDRYVCPTCGAYAQGCDEEKLPRGMQTEHIRDLTAIEFYAALEGLGLPEDRHASCAEVQAALQASPVAQVVGTDISNASRCVVECLVLQDGTRIFLGASSQGAVVYRVARAPGYTQKAGT